MRRPPCAGHADAQAQLGPAREMLSEKGIHGRDVPFGVKPVCLDVVHPWKVYGMTIRSR